MTRKEFIEMAKFENIKSIKEYAIVAFEILKRYNDLYGYTGYIYRGKERPINVMAIMNTEVRFAKDITFEVRCPNASFNKARLENIKINLNGAETMLTDAIYRHSEELAEMWD